MAVVDLDTVRQHRKDAWGHWGNPAAEELIRYEVVALIVEVESLRSYVDGGKVKMHPSDCFLCEQGILHVHEEVAG